MFSVENRWSGANANNNDLKVRPASAVKHTSLAGKVILGVNKAIFVPIL